MSSEPPSWDPVSGWDDEPGRPLPAWVPPPGPGTGEAVTGGGTRFGSRVLPGVGARLGGGAWLRVGPRWRARTALLLAVLAAVAVALLWPGGARDRPAGPAVSAGGARGRPAASAPASPAYAFSRPGGWRDETRALAARFPGPRPELVLAGPASAGATASLSVVRTRAGPGRPSLATVPAAALRRLHAAGARLAGQPRRVALGGEPAVAAEYVLPRHGGWLRARQVACYHRDELYLVTLTAAPRAYPSQRAAQDRVLRTWRWT